MKNKSDLKRKVLCSLLAASTMGIFYSSDALAADLPVDHILVNGSQENSENVGSLVAGDKSYIYGITGGKTYVDTNSIGSMYMVNMGLTAIAEKYPELKDAVNLVDKVSQIAFNNPFKNDGETDTTGVYICKIMISRIM